MSTIHALAAAISVVGFPVFLLSKRKSQQSQNWLEQLRLERNPYQSLRFLAITTPPYKYDGVQVASVYGVVMDYPVKNGTATLAAYVSGEASLYVSNGTGIINGEKHDSVRKAAEELVALASARIDSTLPATRFPMATTGYARFYVLTSEGVRTTWICLSDLKSNGDGAYGLFAEANKVIRALQLTTVMN